MCVSYVNIMFYWCLFGTKKVRVCYRAISLISNFSGDYMYINGIKRASHFPKYISISNKKKNLFQMFQFR